MQRFVVKAAASPLRNTLPAAASDSDVILVHGKLLDESACDCLSPLSQFAVFADTLMYSFPRMFHGQTLMYAEFKGACYAVLQSCLDYLNSVEGGSALLCQLRDEVCQSLTRFLNLIYLLLSP